MKDLITEDADEVKSGSRIEYQIDLDPASIRQIKSIYRRND